MINKKITNRNYWQLDIIPEIGTPPITTVKDIGITGLASILTKISCTVLETGFNQPCFASFQVWSGGSCQ